MQGLELARSYYYECGEPMLKEQFPDLFPLLATGLIGSGSECFGYDDDLSKDHDFEPGFCIFLPDESIIDRKQEFALERAYSKLPKSYKGWDRLRIQPVGGPRHGAIRLSDFVSSRLGKPDPELSPTEWLSLPEQSLAELTNGEIFHDGPGSVTALRQKLAFFPEDVRLKKLAGHLLLMAQSGQYNYMRCIGHHETGASQLALFEFVQSTLHVIFLLNKTYMPYYKWSFRALRDLKTLSDMAPILELLIVSDNSPSQVEEKSSLIEMIASDIITELQNQHLTDAVCMDLEKHAYSVHDRISDSYLRNLHILSAV